MSSSSVSKPTEFDQGWDIIQKGITNLIRILEAPLPEQNFTSEEYMMLYTKIYVMCTQKKQDYSQQLYDKYGEVFKAYITSTVLPALRETHDEFMLRELVKRWINHKVMVRWLSRIFNLLDRYFISRKSLPGLHEVGLACFRDLIYKEEINGKVKDAVISLIDQERKGEQIDRALLKTIFDIFVEIGLDFEAAMLTDTAASYYSQKKNWIIEDFCPDYMLKAEDCLKMEKDRVEPITSEGTSLVKQAEDAASNKELSLHEQSL